MSTERIYLNTPQQTHVVTTVVATRPGAFVVAASPFFVGGGGQPVDTGVVSVDGANQRIEHVEVDADDHIWHHSAAVVVPGQAVDLVVDKQRRRTIEAYARIDFAIEWLDPVMLADLEARMNAVLVAYHPVHYRYVSVAEFAQRSDLLRTKNVQPPAYRGQVRVVEIEGFDAQACGGTHAESTHEVGPCSIYKSENKGKQNKRLYIRFA